MPRKAKAEKESVDLFLRSINIKFDADYPERIAHFQPTTKSVNLIQALLDTDTDRAFFHKCTLWIRKVVSCMLPIKSY